ncbi:ferritin-like domain-containing protein [Mycobacterium sp. 236(2023)]|uniref:ferritin-like domain-containing protein n=1 Tax=Mycobacterium sp. 236(2023) TaxID=3038163 RepID=UPI0024152036|nr:ferritin-like domain-containing protein [Mycobacterium sp. 236(2023)]MDG4664984.1 ferritin-like domain-containing protein [Mycobacterium sp. 236(2023)]
MTSPEPDTTLPTRPDDPAAGALFDAIATEHATIYGYGVVSGHSEPDVNYLVSAAMAEHRARREAAIALAEEQGIAAAVPAAGYQMPVDVETPTEATNLAVQMEEDAAVAWRAVVEQSTDQTVRTFAVTALTECAVTAAKWRVVRGDTAVTVAFPGGSE